MFKTQQIFAFGLILSLGFIYNNCSKVKFDTNAPDVNAAFGTPGSMTPASPANGTLTFNQMNEPATIAYNDNYPEAGDSDYNDFVVNLDVTETYDGSSQLNQIVIKYTPKYKLSGMDHQFILGFDGNIRGRKNVVSNLSKFVSLPMFEGTANIAYKLVDSAGKVLAQEANHNKATDLVVYPSTSQAMIQVQVATITISHIDGLENTYASRGALSIRRYRSVLFNGGYDIDISDIDPKFIDQGGAPVAFFVPVNFRPPNETQSIFPAYPEFRAHALYLMSGADLALEPALTAQWFTTIGNVSLLAP